VRLTIAGLRAESTGGGSQFADFLARVIARLALLESEIEPNPVGDATATFNLDDVIGPVQGSTSWGGTHLPLIASILEREPPIFGCIIPVTQGDRSWSDLILRSDLTSFLDVTSSDDYVSRVLISIGADQPQMPVVAEIDHPLALIDEIGYLDAIWQARTQQPALFGATQVSSCAGLALSCSTSQEFDVRMNALYDVINRLAVPLSEAENRELSERSRRGSLQRLQLFLSSRLPEEQLPRVDESIRTLQTVLRIRAAVHTGSSQRDLPRLYDSIGVRYPPPDYGSAWDSIRVRVAWAVRSLRQTMETSI
jgi:hypothetical protein